MGVTKVSRQSELGDSVGNSFDNSNQVSESENCSVSSSQQSLAVGHSE